MKITRSITILVFFLCLAANTLWSQAEASNWYFGNGAGIRFENDGGVRVMTDGRLNTLEGCATISDDLGQLLFYTDGIVVYNREHGIMPNGRGLYGNPSSSQSAIIVPKPKDPNTYYIFTVDTSVGDDRETNFGLNYSEVDMTAEGGLGNVVQKNIPLAGNSSEKISAVVKDCFEGSFWVVSLISNDTGENTVYDTFHAYEVNENGVSNTAVASEFPGLNIRDGRGYLKLSVDGSRLVTANVQGGLYIYNFDTDTGELSNQQQILIRDSNKFPYGVEFSPNGELLYVCSYNDLQINTNVGGGTSQNLHSSSLIQYQINQTSISATEVVLDKREMYRGALQLAPNGKIYRSLSESYLEGSPYLGVINNPNTIGSGATYRHNAINLGSNMATQGLPPFVQSFFNTIGLIPSSTGDYESSAALCQGDNIILEAPDMPGAQYLWEKDGVPFSNPDNHLFEVSNMAPENAGRYRVTIIPAGPGDCPAIGEAQLSFNPLPSVNPTTLFQCDADQNTADGITALNLEQSISQITGGDPRLQVDFYTNTTNRANNTPIADPSNFTNSVPFNQTVYITVTNANGCVSFGELLLDISPNTPPTSNTLYSCDIDPLDSILEGRFDISPLRTAAPNMDIYIYKTVEDALLERNPVVQNTYTAGASTLFLRTELNNVCQGISETSLVVNPTPAITNIPEDLSICLENPNVPLEAESGYDHYQWYKEETNGNEALIGTDRTITLTTPGEYRLELGWNNSFGPNCNSAKTFTVSPSNIASIDLVEVKDLRENNTVTIQVFGYGDYEFALDAPNGPFQDSNIFENVPAGIATVYVRDKNNCGVLPHEFAVVGYPKFFTPNGDGTNEFWQLIGVNAQYNAQTDILIFDRYGKLVAEVSPDSQGWDGNYNGVPLPASDYWFRLTLEDGRIFKGHFALKR